MNRKRKQIQERREFGKEYLYRRGRADSVIRLESNVFAGESFSACVSPSHIPYFVGTSELKRLCFYKKSSGYFYFFPASGYRNNSDGKLYNSGTNGYGWTSTPYNSSNAWNLNFNSGNANMNNNNRGNGFPVRCVQASAPVFAFTKNTFVFFPASGYRNGSSARLGDSGAGGYEWTSVLAEDGSSWRLVFHSGVAAVGVLSRTYGFSVRCVQASAAVFAFTKDMFVFFPASGYRNNVDGGVRPPGANGHGWTSTSDGGYAWYFRFLSNIAHVNSVSREAGFSVRCVQASATVWVYLEKDFKQIRFRRESGKARLYRRGRADSVTRLGRKFPANKNHFVCAAPSYSISLIKLPVFECLYFYKYASGYFLFFPASGFHYSGDGNLGSSGKEGDGWTSSPGGGDGYYLRFMSAIAQVNTTYRAAGLPVRCVQASVTGFVLFFPASGYLHFNDGKCGGSDSLGYGWTSTPGGAGNAWYLDFFGSYARVNNYDRGHGFTVRCVQASAAVFAFTKDAFVFFPASGYRVYDGGALGNSGTQALAWSSVPSGDGAYRLYSSAAGVFVTTVPRTYGFSVRCVQASATVWTLQKENAKQIRYRRESGKARLCRRGRADSVTRLRRKLSARHAFLSCAALSHVSALIRILILTELCFYKYSSGYFYFFPASGYRNYSDGSLRDSGAEGDGWTSASSGSNASYLRFLSDIAHVNNNNRGNGFPVRCVQASAAVFAFSNYLKRRKKAA